MASREFVPMQVLERWSCPICHMPGQTWAGNPRGTDLTAHTGVVHPEAAQPAPPERTFETDA